jgi:hypothetical protein
MAIIIAANALKGQGDQPEILELAPGISPNDLAAIIKLIR